MSRSTPVPQGGGRGGSTGEPRRARTVPTKEASYFSYHYARAKATHRDGFTSCLADIVLFPGPASTNGAVPFANGRKREDFARLVATATPLPPWVSDVPLAPAFCSGFSDVELAGQRGEDVAGPFRTSSARTSGATTRSRLTFPVGVGWEVHGRCLPPIKPTGLYTNCASLFYGGATEPPRSAGPGNDAEIGTRGSPRAGGAPTSPLRSGGAVRRSATVPGTAGLLSNPLKSVRVLWIRHGGRRAKPGGRHGERDADENRGGESDGGSRRP